MRRFCDHLLVVSITLWVGAMWTVGYLVAPTLFGMIADRALAGNVAGRLFALVGWIGIAAGVYAMVYMFLRLGVQAFRNVLFWLVAVLLLLTLASQFGIQPMMARMKSDAWPREVMESVMRERFAAWHGISSILYLLQSVLAVPLVVGLRRLFR